MKRFVIGDIHGGFKAFKQVLERAGFKPEEDLLISLGDFADGWSEVWECVDYFYNLPNAVAVVGNHDMWLGKWLVREGGYAEDIWTSQGGYASINSYRKHPEDFQKHGQYLISLPKFKVIDDKLFVHGGTFSFHNLEQQQPFDLMWDRELAKQVALRYLKKELNLPPLDISPFKEVYLGHTTTSRIEPKLIPVEMSGVYLLDQGGGYEGKLTLMDIDTKEYWQSDAVNTLYPNEKGR